MPFQPFEFDSSFSPSQGGSILVPEGYYLVRVGGCAPSAEDHDGAPYVTWTLPIVEGPGGIGLAFRYTNTMTATKQFGLATMLQSLDQQKLYEQIKAAKVPTYEAFCALAAVLAKLSGRTLVVEVTTGTYNGRERSEVKGTYPAGKWDDLRQNNDAPRPVVPPAPNGSGNAGAVAQIAAPGALDIGNLEELFTS